MQKKLREYFVLFFTISLILFCPSSFLRNCFIAIGITLFAYMLKVRFTDKKICIDNFSFPKFNNKPVIVLYALLFIFLVSLNIIRIFNVAFWGDECFSILMAKSPISEIIKTTSEDVHPPLYYLVLRAFYLIFGDYSFIYRFVSILPSLILTIFSYTVVRKRYGWKVACWFALLLNLFGTALHYNLEVRMYSMSNLFVFFVFWFGMELIFFDKQNKTNWILFTASALAAAYTHYYAIISVFFIMMGVYIILFFKNKKNFWKCLLSGSICVVGYLPWLTFLFSSFKRTSNYWWSTNIPTFKESIYFILGDDTFTKCVMLFAVAGVTAFLIRQWLKYKPLKVEKDIHFDANFIKELFKNPKVIYTIFAIITFFGTVAVGIIISHLIRPLFLLRYAIGAAAIIALCLALFIGKITKVRSIAIILFCIALVFGSKSWVKIYKIEQESNIQTKQTIELINETYKDGDRVESNLELLTWSVLPCYFEFDSENYDGFDESYLGKTTWLLYYGDLEESFKNGINQNGGSIEVIQNGRLDTIFFTIYKITV